ncbi:MAG: hypothetical protein AB7O67_17120 [Vicinamibacterales bacterium]
MDGAFGELLATSEHQALEFFFLGLKDVCGDDVDRDELLYNASVLAHYAQVSTRTAEGWPTPTSLTSVFDHFVMDSGLRDDREMMEAAGAQCLLLSGFFEDQMRTRHNIRWYAELGAGFFNRAAANQDSQKRALFFGALSRHFEAWRQRQARLSRELRDLPYLLH